MKHINRIGINIALIALLVSIAGCASSSATAVKTELSGFQKEVERFRPEAEAASEAMTSPANDGMLAQRLLIDPTKFDVAVENTSLPVFLMSLVEGTNFNIVVHPDIKGQVFLELKQVTIADVLEVLRDMFDLHLAVSNNLIKIMPNAVETRVFTLDYVNLVRKGASDMRVSAGSIREAGSGGGSNNNDSNNSGNSGDSGSQSEVVGSKITTEQASDLWTSLEAAVQALIGSEQGNRVIVMDQAGVIVVTALRSELDVVANFLEMSELSLQRQVILEAKILEVVLTNRFERGIDWTYLGDVGGAKSGTFDLGLSGSTVANPNGLDGVFSANLKVTDFETIIKMLETQGVVKVLSSPRIATINNQKAVIKVGTDEFFVTNVSSTTTTGTSTTTTPSVTLTPFFSGIALDVTPQISREGDVILHIHPTVSEVSDQNKVVTIGGDTVNLPLALSTIRESDSIVKARNNQIIVIGGLLKNNSKDDDAGIPLLSKIPLFGKGFSQKRQTFERSELVILVKPIVSEFDGQKKDVLDSLRRLTALSGG